MAGVRGLLLDGKGCLEAAGGYMNRKYFGTDGIRGPRQRADHAGARAEGRAGGGPGVSARRTPPSRRDRQGHPAVRLHDRIRAGGGLHLGRHGRAAARPDADAGGRHADALDARRSRRDDFGVPQSVSTTTASSCSARTATSCPTTSRQQIERLIDERPRPSGWRKAAELGRAKRIDGVHDRYIEFAKRTLPRKLSLDGLRVVIDCANGAAYRWRRKRCGNSAPT